MCSKMKKLQFIEFKLITVFLSFHSAAVSLYQYHNQHKMSVITLKLGPERIFIIIINSCIHPYVWIPTSDLRSHLALAG